MSHHNISKCEKISENNQIERKSKHTSKPLEFLSSIVDDRGVQLTLMSAHMSVSVGRSLTLTMSADDAHAHAHHER
jgi:hypothetical protein